MRDQRRELAERLRERSSELEEVIFDRICALASSGSADRRQLRGLRSVIGPAIGYGVDSVELGERQSPHPPPAVVDHARKAAWAAVPLQTLHDHYFAGFSTFQQLLLQECGSLQLLRQVQEPMDVAFRRLTRAVGEEHQRELQQRSRSSDLRRLERVQELLSGEIQEASDLQYPFGGTHLGIVGSGPEVSGVIRQMFRPFGSNLLLVKPELQAAWGWVAVRPDLTSADLKEVLSADSPAEVCIAVGEPAEEIDGWRLTHQQARTACSYAARSGGAFVQYASVALVASTLGDEALMSSLTRRYLEPLATGRGGGTALRETLRAYFATQGHASSAAELLGIKRHTVTNRLQTVERRLARTLSECAAELELALQLDALAEQPLRRHRAAGGSRVSRSRTTRTL